MKSIIREYLASLRERDELDAILPELLSSIGYTVFSRPTTSGVRQYGVDIAALSPREADGGRRVCLFSLKKGDLTRKDWDGGSPQDLRPSLNEILDSYIPARIPSEYRGLKITICICLGGEITEQVRQEVTGYGARHTTEEVNFEEWNGDRIAGYLVEGVLSEDLAPAPARADLRKAVALLDEPDVAYRHFRGVVRWLVTDARTTGRNRVLALRQLYLCSWIIFVWGRDLGNLEAPYRIGELALLTSWELAKADAAQPQTAASRIAAARTFEATLSLYLLISRAFLEKVDPFVALSDALALAVPSQSHLDINLKLFEVLGRYGMLGLWESWAHTHIGTTAAKEASRVPPSDRVVLVTKQIFALVQANPALGSPAADHGAVDIALALLCWNASGLPADAVEPWVEELVARLTITLRSRKRFPAVGNRYEELLSTQAGRSEEAFKAATSGSTLIPLLAIWTAAIGRDDLTQALAEVTASELRHSNLQLWSPGSDSEAHLYLNDATHGRALSSLLLDPTGERLIAQVQALLGDDPPLNHLSACTSGLYPLLFVACRHWRVPIPPEFYIDAAAGSLSSRRPGPNEASETSTTFSAQTVKHGPIGPPPEGNTS